MEALDGARASVDTVREKPLDPVTVLAIAVLMMLLNGGLLRLIHRDLPLALRPSANTWGISTLLMAGGSILLAAQARLPPGLVLPIANAILMLALFGYARAINRFYGVPDARWPAIPVALGTFGIYWFAAVSPSLRARVVISMIVWLIGLSMALWRLLRVRANERSSSRRALVAIFASLLMIMLLRAAYFAFGSRVEQTILDRGSWVNLATPMASAVLPVIGTTAFLLLLADRTRRQLLESQNALVQREKLAALGQLVASVAHELNTPLGAIRASAGNLAAAVESTIRDVPQMLAATTPEERARWVALVLEAAVRPTPRTSREERAARLLLNEALDAAGIDRSNGLAASLVNIGVAGDISPHLPLLRSPQREPFLRSAFDITSLARSSRNIQDAVDRAAKIVFALKTYAHPGDSSEITKASLADKLDRVLTLYHSQIKQGVDLVTNYQDRGEVEARHDALDQVWTNLIHNALQAMAFKGRLDVSVEAEGDDVVVSIVDSGVGIPDDVLGRIFEPFFTTKPAGEGSGLGLSICKDLVAGMGGRITVESRPGRTRFSVRLPRTHVSLS